MTIKEIEDSSGMSRANIRFYESEGLLSPERGANGYRNYSEHDLETLTRIKLLRTLHISLENIRALQTGTRALSDVLTQQLELLRRDRTELEASQKICEAMRSDGVRYESLNARFYLGTIERTAQVSAPELEMDAIAKVRSPWRRLFARSLDLYIYSCLWNGFLALVLNVNFLNATSAERTLRALVNVILMLFMEPALLSVFGTTVGKWILGMSVTDNDGARLSYSKALSRTRTALWRGCAFFSVPLYNLYRFWKSYCGCIDGETLEWEYESTITLRDESRWRVSAYISAFAALSFLISFTFTMAGMPKNRGDISVAEFCENYNRLYDFYDIEAGPRLSENASWTEDDGVSISIGSSIDEPEIVFSEEGGAMTGLTLSTSLRDVHAWPPSYQDRMILAIMSFVRAQRDCSPYSDEFSKLIEEIENCPFEDFEFTLCGIKITCYYEYSGYLDPSGADFLFPENKIRNYYYFSFSMEKA